VVQPHNFHHGLLGAKVAIPLLGASKFALEGMLDALHRELMLFGIDVVTIEAGTVNTAMYDKGEQEDLSEFKQAEYCKALQNFQEWIVNEARTNGSPLSVWAKPLTWHSARQNRRHAPTNFVGASIKSLPLSSMAIIKRCRAHTLCD